MSLVSKLAGGRVSTLPRIGGFEPVREIHDGPKCHAGAGHEPAKYRQSFGWLCDSCWAATVRLIGRIVT